MAPGACPAGPALRTAHQGSITAPVGTACVDKPAPMDAFRSPPANSGPMSPRVWLMGETGNEGACMNCTAAAGAIEKVGLKAWACVWPLETLMGGCIVADATWPKEFRQGGMETAILGGCGDKGRWGAWGTGPAVVGGIPSYPGWPPGGIPIGTCCCVGVTVPRDGTSIACRDEASPSCQDLRRSCCCGAGAVTSGIVFMTLPPPP
mmetsp:Transcript_9203/g.24147  ORF Transcript_9203/g.24147 Transcript_9203/m.24147 type:complete len:206 (+) Transcript_9203:170-787(+)